jgi:DNA-binding IclR family transcriptional regulator
MNEGETESGLTAVGAALPAVDGCPAAAISLAMPSVRFSRDALPAWGAALVTTAEAIAAELAG